MNYVGENPFFMDDSFEQSCANGCNRDATDVIYFVGVGDLRYWSQVGALIAGGELTGYQGQIPDVEV